MNFSTTLCSP
ncbi:hypothetical protein CP061683_1089A, partial [Chlamydia psittaci 06-1683]